LGAFAPQEVTASITVTDAAGNSATATDTQAYLIEGTGPQGQPLIALDANIAGDGVINAVESTGLVAVTGTVSGIAKSGDAVEVTVNGVRYAATVTAGLTYSVNVLGTELVANPNVTAKVTSTNSLGDLVSANTAFTYGVDIAPPLPSIALDANIAVDGIINLAESLGDIAVTGTVAGDAKVGDTVVVSVNGTNYNTQVIALAGGQLGFTVDVPGAQIVADPIIDATVTTVDSAGNVGTGSTAASYGVDLTPPTVTVNVSEEGLPGAEADTIGSPDTTNAATVSGTVTVNVGTVTLTAPAEALTSGGVPVTWTGSGTNTVIGSAAGVEVIRATIDNNGNYTVTLSKAVDHASAGEDIKSLGFGVAITDAAGGVNTGALNVNIEDDSPLVGQNAIVSALNGTANTNLSIVLDLSGSMNDNSGIGGSRLSQAKLAIQALVNGYDEYGDVMVNITTFGSVAGLAGANDGVWLSAANALTFLNGLSVYTGNNAGTNYDAALAEAISDFGNAGKIPDGQNVLYFLSDGQPQTGDGNSGLVNQNGGNSSVGISTAEEAIWTTHLNNNQINAFAVSVGTGVTVTSMNPIAYDGSTATNRDAQVVTISQLQTTLLSTIVIKSTGTLVDGAISGFGADGGYVQEIAVEGTTYSYNQATGVLTVAGTNNSTYDNITHQVTITTSTGGKLTLDMDDGNYNYLSSPTPSGTTETQFSYTLIDNDGDIATGAITFNNGTTLTGTSGNDTLIGGITDDTIVGGAGNDVIIGNTGNDTLTGGTGADVFKWNLGDDGAVGTPAADMITDFNVAEGDVLDLKDLLIGENAGNLTNFLHFEESGANTIVHVNSAGNIGAGDTQTITLENVSLTDLGGANDAAIIANLLANNQLIVDQ